MAALRMLDYTALWWDKCRTLESLALSEIFNFILNILLPISLGFFSLPISRKPWITVRWISTICYNLDTKLRSPAKLGGLQGAEGLPPGLHHPRL
ncbi:unnamed protein product [Staurois parvus]|uniref:ubiquitinyl hydrolase 1 n=1 Tax=Staurois parvus TaxID=386267 RepID=A0ABN9E1Z7_9NEOB|nr:unnamed protein product [Staurois parvus]